MTESNDRKDFDEIDELEELDEIEATEELEDVEELDELDKPTSEEVMAEIEDILGDSVDQYAIIMEDEESGNEFTFYLVDDFEFENEVYAILVNAEESPEAVIAKVTTDEEGNMGFSTIVDDEFDRVASFYEMLAEDEEEDL